MKVYQAEPSITHLGHHCASCERKIRGGEWVVSHRILQEGNVYGRFLAHVECLRTEIASAPNATEAAYELARDELLALRDSL